MLAKTIFVLAASLVAAVVHGERYLFTNGHLVTMTDDQVIASDLLVDGDRIAAVGTDLASDGAIIVDMQGGYLMPGVAEMHAHVPQPSADRQYRDDVLFLWVANGVTTARSMLGHAEHLSLKKRIERHEVLGPRIVTSGPSFNGNSVSSPEQAAAMVRSQVEAGFDFLKIHPGLTRAEYDAMADTAHQLGIEFAGHIPLDIGLRHALSQGQLTVDHADGYVRALVPGFGPQTPGYRSSFGVGLVERVDLNLLPELVTATRAANTWVVPTQTLLENFAGDIDELTNRPEFRYLPPPTRANYRRAIEGRGGNRDAGKALVNLRQAIIIGLHNGGAGLLLGSDAPQIFNVPGFSIHRELQSLVDAGLSPYDAIATGSVNVARFFDMQDEFGQLRSGLAADLILLEHNPLERIEHTRGIRGVMVRGRWLDEATRSQGLADIARRYADG